MKNYDKIIIKDLLLRCIIGINEEERHKKQDVIINITLYSDLKKVSINDSIEDAVNYKTVTKKIIKMVEKSSYFLIERLAEEIAVICLGSPEIKQVDVRVDKPGALRFADSVAAEITRYNE